MAGYKPKSLIVLQPLSYVDANDLMLLISNYLQEKNIIFIHNLDNWGNSSGMSKTIRKNSFGYSVFRVCPLMENLNSKTYKNFLGYYQKKFHSVTPNAVSYMTYTTIISVIDALDIFNVHKESNIRTTVLLSFRAALKKNPHWYRPAIFTYYQLNMGEEKRQEVI